jgi:hypothetical protein
VLEHLGKGIGVMHRAVVEDDAQVLERSCHCA